MMKKLFVIFAILYGFVACAEHDGMTSENLGQYPITVSSTYPASDLTRAVVDGGFVAGDATGLFVVDYDADGQSGEVLMRGNRASNMKFTLQENGKWTSAVQLYWANQQTPADFYGYYPFDQSMTSVTDYTFGVSANQAGDDGSLSAAGYTASDLLLAKATKVQPTAETVILPYKHLMAGVNVILQKGSGFSDAEWAAFDKTVLLRNTLLAGQVNLVEGTTSISDGERKTIVPLLHNGSWRGIVFPQTVTAGKPIVSVTVDGQAYQLENTDGMTFQSGKMHKFTIEVNRTAASGEFTFTLLDEAILPWQNDAELHEGLVREYVIVETLGAGRLEETLAAMKLDNTELEAMMVKGDINRADMEFMGQQMKNLMNLNLSHATIVGEGEDEGLLTGFRDHDILRHFVFPEKGVKKIDDHAFHSAGLLGSLVIPEGVEEIGDYAFSNWKVDEDFFDIQMGGYLSLTGTLTLPSTLKRIGVYAFTFNRLSGELNLPEGLEELGYDGSQNWGPFEGNNFSGTLNIPVGVKEVFFHGFPNMHGDIIIPQGVTKIRPYAFESSGFDGIVEIPEGVTEIGKDAFRDTKITGELVLPSTLTSIGGFAFGHTNITKIFFPDNLKVMEDGAPYDEFNYYDAQGTFSHCTRLSGVIEFAKNVARVPKCCFFGCTSLEGIVLSENVTIIDEMAFAKCAMLNSIVCENPEPPLVCKDAFLGVSKDNFTLEVPKGSVEKYKNATGWSDFKRISEVSDFVCRPSQIQALNTQHVEELIINANAEWTVSSKPEWVTLSATSGVGKTALNATFQKLSHGAGIRQGEVVFQMQQDGQTYETKCTVSQYDYEQEEDSYLTLQTATKGSNGGIDIVFVGDGWDGAGISDGSYLEMIKYQTECFFAIEPYRSMRDYFNVYVTFPLSQEKGVNTMYTYVNNHFGTLQGASSLASCCTSAQLITESDQVVEYVIQKTPVTNSNLYRTTIILVPNATGYEGNTLLADNGMALSICPPSDNVYPRDTRGIIQHEAGGHGFGKLGDEAIKSGRCGYGFIPETEAAKVRQMHWRGWYQNLSLSGKLSDVSWAEFIFDPDYSDYVDVYEGGFGYMRGVYRPEANSCMNYGIPYYNTPSRLEIWKRIKEYAGESWTMEEFRAQDTFEWGPSNVTRSAAMPTAGQGYAESNRHVIPSIVDFKKMGQEVRHIREQLKSKKVKK